MVGRMCRLHLEEFRKRNIEIRELMKQSISMLRLLICPTCSLQIRPTIQVSFLSLVQTDVYLVSPIFYGSAMTFGISLVSSILLFLCCVF